MTAPAVDAGRFGWAVVLGLALGAVYDFLRPLRPKATTLADMLFLGSVFRAALELGFGICRGDLRLGYFLGFPLGALVWEATAGRLFRPLFFAFWRLLGKGAAAFALPWKKFFHFAKILFASMEKWVTIKWTNRRRSRRDFGGAPNGTDQRVFQADQAGSPSQFHSEQSGADHHHRIVYGSPGDAGPGCEQN